MPSYGSCNVSSKKVDASVTTHRLEKKAAVSLRKEKPPISPIGIGLSSNLRSNSATVNTFGSVMPDITSEVDLNTTSGTDVEGKSSYTPNILEKSLERTITYHLRRRKKISKWLMCILAVLIIICNTALLVVVPIYISSMSRAGGDEMVALLSVAVVLPLPLMAMSVVLKHLCDKSITLKPVKSLVWYGGMGLCQALRWNLMLFSSHPDKTPQQLQPALSGATLPASLLGVLVLLKKGTSRRRLVCCVVALVGIFVSVEPIIWSVSSHDSSGRQLFQHQDQLVWPVVFGLSFVPLVIFLVMAEREVSKNQIHMFSTAVSGMLAACVLSVLFSFLNFLPGYGNVSSFTELWNNTKAGFTCTFSSPPGCDNSLVKLLVLVTSLGLTNIFSVLLVSGTADSVFVSLVLCLSIPLASGVPTVFKYDYRTGSVDWLPHWSHTTTFLLISCVLLTSTVLVYRYFSVRDAKDKQRETKGNSDISSSEYEWD